MAALPSYVEIDAGTERLQSTKDIDSLERKARIYEQHQARCYREFRYRVLFLALRGSRRVSQFLDLAAQQQTNPNRTVFYGAYLNDYLQSPDRLFSQLFRTKGSQRVVAAEEAGAQDVGCFAGRSATAKLQTALSVCRIPRTERTVYVTRQPAPVGRWKLAKNTTFVDSWCSAAGQSMLCCRSYRQLR